MLCLSSLRYCAVRGLYQNIDLYGVYGVAFVCSIALQKQKNTFFAPSSPRLLWVCAEWPYWPLVFNIRNAKSIYTATSSMFMSDASGPFATTSPNISTFLRLLMATRRSPWMWQRSNARHPTTTQSGRLSWYKAGSLRSSARKQCGMAPRLTIVLLRTDALRSKDKVEAVYFKSIRMLLIDSLCVNPLIYFLFCHPKNKTAHILIRI